MVIYGHLLNGILFANKNEWSVNIYNGDEPLNVMLSERSLMHKTTYCIVLSKKFIHAYGKREQTLWLTHNMSMNPSQVSGWSLNPHAQDKLKRLKE